MYELKVDVEAKSQAGTSFEFHVYEKWRLWLSGGGKVGGEGGPEKGEGCLRR